jgi:hypothetical protein
MEGFGLVGRQLCLGDVRRGEFHGPTSSSGKTLGRLRLSSQVFPRR